MVTVMTGEQSFIVEVEVTKSQLTAINKILAISNKALRPKTSLEALIRAVKDKIVINQFDQ